MYLSAFLTNCSNLAEILKEHCNNFAEVLKEIFKVKDLLNKKKEIKDIPGSVPVFSKWILKG